MKKEGKYIHHIQCIHCDTCGVCTNPLDTDADITLSHSSFPPYKRGFCHMRRVIEAFNTETQMWTTLELLEETEALKN